LKKEEFRASADGKMSLCWVAQVDGRGAKWQKERQKATRPDGSLVNGKAFGGFVLLGGSSVLYGSLS
jgi:hypothetical protein